jgi:hypothetical protein
MDGVKPPISHVVIGGLVMMVIGLVIGGTLGDAEPAVLLSAIAVVALLTPVIFFRLER